MPKCREPGCDGLREPSEVVAVRHMVACVRRGFTDSLLPPVGDVELSLEIALCFCWRTLDPSTNRRGVRLVTDPHHLVWLEILGQAEHPTKEVVVLQVALAACRK